MLQGIVWGEDPVIYFVGKYLWTKGIQLILLTNPVCPRKMATSSVCFYRFWSF